MYLLYVSFCLDVRVLFLTPFVDVCTCQSASVGKKIFMSDNSNIRDVNKVIAVLFNSEVYHIQTKTSTHIITSSFLPPTNSNIYWLFPPSLETNNYYSSLLHIIGIVGNKISEPNYFEPNILFVIFRISSICCSKAETSYASHRIYNK